ncbi:MAG: class B sortase [Oscillospiraceae bacterium]|nr:class B sortase [Oscillospiraceae bacterium]
MSKKIKKIIYWIMLVAFSAVFVVSAVLVGRYLVDTIKQRQQMNDIANMHTTGPNSQITDPTVQVTQPNYPTEPGETYPPTEPPVQPILPELVAIHALNNDVVGWISIEGTDINYPVMQTPRFQNYYLDKDFYKQYSAAGQIYVREACDVFAPSDNVTIYGHNMANGSMFGQLHRYRKSKDFYEQHKYIQFDTLYEHHTYEIIAVFITSGTYGVGYPYHLFDKAIDKEEFDNFVSSCKALGLYDIPVTAEYGDKLLTLSTCYDYIDNGRLVILAKRIK